MHLLQRPEGARHGSISDMDGQSGSEAHLWADWQDVSRLMFIAPGAARCDDWGAEAELIELLTLRWLWRMRAAGRAAAMRRCDDAMGGRLYYRC